MRDTGVSRPIKTLAGKTASTQTPEAKILARRQSFGIADLPTIQKVPLSAHCPQYPRTSRLLLISPCFVACDPLIKKGSEIWASRSRENLLPLPPNEAYKVILPPVHPAVPMDRDATAGSEHLVRTSGAAYLSATHAAKGVV